MLAMMAMMAMMALATPGDRQRGRAEVGEGSDGGGEDYGKQPIRSSAEASPRDDDGDQHGDQHGDHGGDDASDDDGVCNADISPGTCKPCTRSQRRRTAR